MSELTSCNYCTLKRIKERHPGSAVTVLPDPDNPPWLGVWVDSHRIGVSFLELSEGCVC